MSIKKNEINMTIYNIGYIIDSNPLEEIKEIIEDYKKQDYTIKYYYSQNELVELKTTLKLHEIEADNNKKTLTLKYY